MIRNAPRALVLSLALVAMSPAVHADMNVVVERSRAERSEPSFSFRVLGSPSNEDLGQEAEFTVIAGRRDPNGATTSALHDGAVPSSADSPRDNFFFAAGSSGGRVRIDLGSARGVDRVSTYSWHPGARGPQVYGLWAAKGDEEGFVDAPAEDADLEAAGWTLVAEVDTRPERGDPGGQYAVAVFHPDGAIGPYRYLLLDVATTDASDPFGQTFFSEIDVFGGEVAVATGGVATFEAEGGVHEFTIDTSGSPDLTKWATEELAPIVAVWYPKIAAMLPSDGYEAPRRFSITIGDDIGGVAAAGGSRIRCSGTWFRRNLEGEAKGAVVHELVHVVQRYGRRRGRGGDGQRYSRPPGWLVEGIPDYIRWFLYEPGSGGAAITTRRALERARHDASYRTSANFLDWVVRTHDEGLIPALNAILREGRYDESVWEERTGMALDALAAAWKASLAAKIEGASEPESDDEDSTEESDNEDSDTEDSDTEDSEAAALNALTDEEREAGWKLLFDGEDFEGWHTFRRDDVRPGWKVQDGLLVCADPSDAGDLCTDEAYGWFELRLEYRIAEAGNSGILYHVTDEGRATWATGPEFQLEDNAKAKDPVRAGWLYALYEPPVDPETGEKLDATKPAGEWNEVRLLISPEKCVHAINGVEYFEYVLGSEDFEERVRRSKFRRMPLFAKSREGSIALQGDHGEIAFRNLKIREIEAEEEE